METSYREFLQRKERSAVRRLETGEFFRPADRAYAEYQVRAYRDAAAYVVTPSMCRAWPHAC